MSTLPDTAGPDLHAPVLSLLSVNCKSTSQLLKPKSVIADFSLTPHPVQCRSFGLQLQYIRYQALLTTSLSHPGPSHARLLRVSSRSFHSGLLASVQSVLTPEQPKKPVATPHLPPSPLSGHTPHISQSHWPPHGSSRPQCTLLGALLHCSAGWPYPLPCLSLLITQTPPSQRALRRAPHLELRTPHLLVLLHFSHGPWHL